MVITREKKLDKNENNMFLGAIQEGWVWEALVN